LDIAIFEGTSLPGPHTHTFLPLSLTHSCSHTFFKPSWWCLSQLKIVFLQWGLFMFHCISVQKCF